MNSEAERARNARKRAKLRAKKRGDAPSLRRVSVTIRVWATDPDLFDRELVKVCEQTCAGPVCAGVYLCYACKTQDFRMFRKCNAECISGERLLTRHEMQDQDLTWLEVYCVAVNKKLRLYSTPSHPAHADICVEVHQCGQQRKEEWRIEVGEVVAADLAAEMGCL